MNATVKKDGAGYYSVTVGHRAVTVLKNSALSGSDKWVAYANWDHCLVTDPVGTKRQAVDCALIMLRGESR
jgi:hypothetical protein